MNKIVIFLLFLIYPVNVYSQSGNRVWEEFEKRISQSKSIQPATNNVFGDEVNLSNGELSFSVTDINVPGNSFLPVSMTRTYGVRNRREYVTDSMLADWDLDLPSISGIFAYGWESSTGISGKRCSLNSVAAARPPSMALLAEEYWNGNHINLPGSTKGELLLLDAAAVRPALGTYHWIADGQTYVSCLPSIKNGSGEGFQALTSDGTRYWFDWMAQTVEPNLVKDGSQYQRRKYILYATRVEDRFGNIVTYEYTNAWNARPKLVKISDGEGRQITFQHNSNNNISSATSGSQVWSYQYAALGGGNSTLTKVVRPDNSEWALSLSAFTLAAIRFPQPHPTEPVRDCFNNPVPYSPSEMKGIVVSPSGATGEFFVNVKLHGRSNVPVLCENYYEPSNDPDDDVNKWVINYYGLSLTKKRVGGVGVEWMEWGYDYLSGTSYLFYPGATLSNPCPAGTDCGAPICTSDACAGRSRTTVTGPAGEWKRFYYGNSFKYNEGKLLKTESGSATTTLRTVDNFYDFSLSNQQYLARLGHSPRINEAFQSEYQRPLHETKIIQDGVTFSRAVSSGCAGGNYCFDMFARPTSITKSNTIAGSSNRLEVTQYYDNLTAWVLGQQAKLTVNGSEVAHTTFNAAAQPAVVKAFGKVQQSFTYFSNGSIGTVKDGNNNVTLLSDWKRGIPQRVQHAATPESPSGAIQQLQVNNNGWIDWTKDENGFQTSYTYDAMGRLASVAYPTGDATVWNNTTQAFQPVSSAEYGIPPGHWRQTVTTGTGLRITYFDALWRPLLVREYDTANESGTQRFSRFIYDHEGRVTFSSYPSTVSNPTTGTWSTYDALGRPTLIKQDWEGSGQLTTKTEYLSGFLTRLTNPRGHNILTRYKVWDQPTYDYPIIIDSASGASEVSSIDITRDDFGKPTAIRKRDRLATVALTRSYTYNAHQELCRTVEPETGSNFMGYDGAGNLAWSASGYATTQAGCQSAQVVASRRVDRTYDARNRLKTLTFPDNRGNQSWTYTPDGLPAQISAVQVGVSAPTISEYSYNRRRLTTSERQTPYVSETWTLAHNYNANGHLTDTTYPSGLNVSYAPNALGQPTKAGTFATGVSYFPNGAIKQFTYGNGIVHTLTQNARGLPDTSCDFYGSCNASAVINDGYDYDANGNVAAISDGRSGARGNRTMTYDALDRLTQTISPMFGTANYAYDALDNLSRVTVGATAMTAARDHFYCYDNSWRLTNVKTSSCSGATVAGIGYDAQGNLSNKNGSIYEFDFGNRLRKVGTGITYGYDALGRRTSQTSGTTNPLRRRFMYGLDGSLPYESVLSNWNTDSIYLNGRLIARRTRPLAVPVPTDSVTYQHTDVLGSPVAVTDQGRAVVESTEYEPYGAPGNRPFRNGAGYTGHAEDSIGLTYMQQRYYDPMLGLFLSADPVTAYENPVTQFHRYRYANNNPYRFVDPDGRVVETGWDLFSFGLGINSLAGNVRQGNWRAAGLDSVGVIADGAAVLLPGIPGGAGAGIKAARSADAAIGVVRGAEKAADGTKRADFIVTPHGTAVPTSQSRMTNGFEAAGIQGTPLPDGKGVSYTMPDGVNVRAMEPSGPGRGQQRRASFNNSNGGPVTPDGNVPQPPREATRAEKRNYVRDGTHVEQDR